MLKKVQVAKKIKELVTTNNKDIKASLSVACKNAKKGAAKDKAKATIKQNTINISAQKKAITTECSRQINLAKKKAKEECIALLAIAGGHVDVENEEQEQEQAQYVENEEQVQDEDEEMDDD